MVKAVKRTCKACGDVKPLGDFPVYVAGKYKGRRHTCRTCTNAKMLPIIKKHQAHYYHKNENGHRDKARARANQAYKLDPRATAERNKLYAERHPDRAAAKAAVAAAVRSGTLKRAPCEVCGNKPSHGHHDDYSRPLDVMWLCRTHHGERHRLLNRGLVERRVA